MNYQFRDRFDFSDKFFMIMFAKRVFYVYMSVLIVIVILLSIVHKITMSMTLYEFLRNLTASQTAGLMGAVTFSFFRRS